jgi:hypothetical protein
VALLSGVKVSEALGKLEAGPFTDASGLAQTDVMFGRLQQSKV